MSRIEVAELVIYPIKSCGGISREAMTLGRRGPEHDRRWMLVDENARFVTQREEHALALVRVDFAAADALIVTAGDRVLELPAALERGERIDVVVWRSTVAALSHGKGSRWFSELLGRDVRLVYMPEDSERMIPADHARAGEIVSFADAYPLLVVSQASLDDLNRRLEAPLEMRRFRPNLVLRGTEPYAEDAAAEFSIGALRFRTTEACSRCVVTTLDPDSGRPGKEPLRTLASYRERDGQVFFGMNAIHQSIGTLRVGAPVIFG